MPRKLPRPTPPRDSVNALDAPMSIYEVHLGSWRRKAEDGNRWLTYRELAEQLPAYAADMGFTHVELLPVSEHPFDGSWGYQPTGLFAPTSRFGTPADFVAAGRRLPPQAGLGVLLDWVPGHFPDDPHGLGALRRHRALRARRPDAGPPSRLGHADLQLRPRRSDELPDRQRAVLARALRHRRAARRCGRLDALSRLQPPGRRLGPEQLRRPREPRRHRIPAPHQHGSVRASIPHATTAAEESTAWPMVSRPVDWGGLGFGYKWNMGWMHDTLDYISKDPIYRRHHHGNILFGLHYAFSENFILPLSHDEVVHGKRSILGRMPGDDWQRFANLRAYYGFMFGHPGQEADVHGLRVRPGHRMEPRHQPALASARAAEPCRRAAAGARPQPALPRRRRRCTQLDCDAAGFEWLVADDANHSVFAWLRKGSDPNERCVVVVNFTPQVLRDYRVRVPFAGTLARSAQHRCRASMAAAMSGTPAPCPPL